MNRFGWTWFLKDPTFTRSCVFTGSNNQLIPKLWILNFLEFFDHLKQVYKCCKKPLLKSNLICANAGFVASKFVDPVSKLLNIYKKNDKHSTNLVFSKKFKTLLIENKQLLYPQLVFVYFDSKTKIRFEEIITMVVRLINTATSLSIIQGSV